MKKLLTSTLIITLAGIAAISCKKDLLSTLLQTTTQITEHTIVLKPSYSTQDEFKQAIAKVGNQLQSAEVVAYLDTLPNGYPDLKGRKTSLASFAYAILEKLGGNSEEVESAVNDVFHFDGSTFSLISYIMKAHMVNNISLEMQDQLLDEIPLPPIPMEGFEPPMEPVIPDTPVYNCCDFCNPQLDILTTSTYVAPCGNYSTTVSGHVVNNKLTHISRGRHYRFDGQLSGCDCPGGKWTSTVDIAGIATLTKSDSWIAFDTFTGGTYTVTISYTVCGKTVSKTILLSVD